MISNELNYESWYLEARDFCYGMAVVKSGSKSFYIKSDGKPLGYNKLHDTNSLFYDKAYDFKTKVTSDLILKAKWEKIIQWTVTFDKNNGSSNETKVVNNGEKVTNFKDVKCEYIGDPELANKIILDTDFSIKWKDTIERECEYSLSNVSGTIITLNKIINEQDIFEENLLNIPSLEINFD